MMSTVARLCRSAVPLCLAAIAALTAPAQQTRRVPQDYSTIQSAINASQTGDTVSVAPGTYFENLSIDTKEITLVSTGGASSTILDGSHLGPVLKITNTPSTRSLVSGFTIQNGSPLSSNGASLSVGPAGVLIASAGAQITNSTLAKNAGINIGVINGSLTLTASQISTASTAGGSCALSAGSTYLNPSTGVYLSGTSTVLTGTHTDLGSAEPTDAIGKPHPTVLSQNTIFGDGTACSGTGVQAVNLGQPLLILSNTLRNNAVAITTDTAPVFLIQNLIYDNVSGALHLTDRAVNPNVDPATTQIVNNTIVNNLTSPAASTDPAALTDIFLDGTAAHIQFVNNILVGTTSHPVLTCASATPSLNDTPLLFANNDLFNTTRAANSLAAGDCFPGLSNPLSTNGNLSLDPQLTGSTDLHPLPNSPVIDAGSNSAPGLIFLPFTSGAPDLGPPTAAATGLADFVASYGPDRIITTPFFDVGGGFRFLDGSASGHNTIDIGAYEAPRAANSPAQDRPVSTVVSASTYLTPPGPVTFQALSQSFYAYGQGNPTTFSINGVPQASVPLDSNSVANFSTTFSAPGLYTVVASTSALTNNGYPSSTSTPIYIRVTDSPAAGPTTTLTIAASPTTQILNQPVTLTIHLGSTTPAAGGTTQPGPIPPGALTLSEGSTILSSLKPDASGLVTYTIPHPTVGPHTYTVTYAGTTLYPAATATTSVSVTAPVATTLSARPDQNPVALGQTVACIATVVAASGSAPTGTVTFTDGATVEGTVHLTSPGEQGIATLALSNLSFGLHTITVTFQPDPGFGPSSGTCTINVGGNATVTTLTSSKNPAATTDSITYTITVTNPTAPSTAPAGSVTLYEGNTLLASSGLNPGPSAGSAIAYVTLSTPGAHILTATYIPATTATFTSSATLTEIITAAPPIAIALTAFPNPATVGQTITLSAAVTSSAAIPGPATITFSDGALTLGSLPLPASGIVTLPVSTLSLGTHSLTAALHTGIPDTVRSLSKSLSVQINGLPATLTLTANPAPTALAAAPVTLSASLVPAAPLSPGVTLSGTVTFADGGAPLGVASLSADGHASFPTTTLVPGPHTLTATFSGNTVFSSTAAAAITETILANSTATQLTAPSQSLAFAPVTLAAHVTSASSAPVNTLLCTPACAPVAVTFFADSPTGRTNLGTTALNAAGIASLTITPAAGAYSLSASFSGSPLFSGSSSPAATLVVSPVTAALSLTANPNPVYQHGAVTLAATVSAPGIPTSALTGSITFLEGSTTLGTTSLAAAESFAYSPTTVGPHALTAVFSGNASLSGATASTTVTVLASDFVLSVKDTTLTIATTHHAPTTVSINATGALSDLIDLSCANLPQFAHCGFTPATQDLTQTNASTGTLMLDTDALLNYASSHPPAAPRNSSAFTAILALTIPPAFFAALTGLRRRRHAPESPRTRLPHLLAALLLSVTAITLSGCSGLYPSHVAPGTYTVTITGHARTSGIEHSTQLTLVVTQ